MLAALGAPVRLVLVVHEIVRVVVAHEDHVAPLAAVAAVRAAPRLIFFAAKADAAASAIARLGLDHTLVDKHGVNGAESPALAKEGINESFVKCDHYAK